MRRAIVPVIDERARHDLYRGLEELLGTGRADTLMSLLPGVGWADVATKHDVRLIQGDLGRLNDDLRDLDERIDARMDARFVRVDARFACVDAQLAGVDARFTDLETRMDARFHESSSRFERALREQTRTLMLGSVGAMFTMTSLCLGAIALAV
jgi:hypothetical protein